jgi:hypothetical protein
MVDVLTQHADNDRSGAYAEDLLDWKNVSVESFGKVGEYATQGFIWAQPLFVSGVPVAGKGTKDLVIVATARNRIYAFDAEEPRGAPVWATVELYPPVPSRTFGNGAGDIYRTTVGILGTPAIELVRAGGELKSATLFAIAWKFKAAKFDKDPPSAYEHWLVAIDLTIGEKRRVKPNSVQIKGEVPGKGYFGTKDDDARLQRLAKRDDNPPRREGPLYIVDNEFAPDLRTIDLWGRITDDQRGDNRTVKITDAIHRGGTDYVQFNSCMQLQRPGLLLKDGIIYSAFGARADQDPYHGWVFAHRADNLECVGVFCTSQNGGRAGIWQAGEGISCDENGDIYVGTGNGDIFPGSGCYGDCLLKLGLDPDETKTNRLVLKGYSNAFEELFKEDEDFGASSPTMLPGGYMAGGGKDGHFYLFKHSDLTQNGDPKCLKQLFLASFDPQSKGPGNDKDQEFNHHIHGSPVVYRAQDGLYLYVWGENDLLRCFRFDPNTGLFPKQPTDRIRGKFGTPRAVGDIFCSADGPHDSMHGGFMAVSAKGVGGGRPYVHRSGIVWASIPAFENGSQSAVEGELRAYQADAFVQERDVELNDQGDKKEASSDDGTEKKEKKEKAKTSQGRLVTLWSSRCNLERDDAGFYPKFCVPMIAKGRVYLPSFTDGGKLMVYGLLEKCDGGYNLGEDGPSDLVFNGDACVRKGAVCLIEAPHPRLIGNPLRMHAGSVFSRRKVPLANFRTVFEVESDVDRDRFEGHHRPAEDGFAFVIQNNDVYALGEAGAGFGFAANETSKLSRERKICPSFAVTFELRNSTLGFYVDGEPSKYVDGEPPKDGGLDRRPSGVNLRRPIQVTLSYRATTLTVFLEEKVSGFSMEHSLEVGNLVERIGREAYVGFSAGSGAAGCAVRITRITRWKFGDDKIARK